MENKFYVIFKNLEEIKRLMCNIGADNDIEDIKIKLMKLAIKSDNDYQLVDADKPDAGEGFNEWVLGEDRADCCTASK